MTKKDIAELKRRLKKDECTFTKMCGCYVDGHKNIILHLNETFLNLVDDEFYKYLEIAKKTLSGTIGNNILDLEFLSDESNVEKQQFFLGLRDSKLKNDALLERFYELVIENYTYTGNYLILIFHDAYDVIVKTNDNNKLDESEEVYEYLLCAICPVELSKAGLGYREDENRIGARVRDWVVFPPETGFLFPAFSERSSDIHSLMYYTKNAKESRSEFIQAGLGCKPKQTKTEQKKTFKEIIEKTIDCDEEKKKEIFLEIQQNLNNVVEEHHYACEKEPLILTNDKIKEIIADSGVPEEVVQKIEESCIEEFGDTPPIAENLIDAKLIEENARKKKEQNLHLQIHSLKQELEDTKLKSASTAELEGQKDTEGKVETNYDIVLKVKPQKISQIKSQIIDGQKCIVIPLDENEQTNINGVTTTIETL